MKILFNHTLRSIKQNKGQFLVIVLTITVVTCMLFVALTVGDLFYNLQLSLKSRVANDTDIKIEGIFSQARLEEFYQENTDSIEYMDTYMQMGGLFRNETGDDRSSKVILIEATNLANFYQRHKDTLTIYQYYEFSYQYPEVWIGRSFAAENNIKIGDIVQIYLEYTKSYQKMTVTCIFENYGMFANSVVNNIMVDFATVSSRGILTTAYISLKEGVSESEFTEHLSSYLDNSELVIGSAVDYAEINKIVSNNQKLLNVALVFIIALILFILFTSYLVMAKNRLNELITFKTAGASNRQIITIMLLEGALYGAFGAICGLIIGRAGMSFAASKVIPNFPDAIKYNVLDFVLSFVLGVAISVAAAVVPTVRASKESVRILISGAVKEGRKPNMLVALFSSVLIIACVLLLVLVPNQSIAVLILLLAIITVLIMTVMPYIVKGVSYLFSFGKGASRISSYGLKRNSHSYTLSALIGSIMVFTFLVVSIINVIVFAIKPYNERFESDFVVESVEGTNLKETAAKMESVHGVKHAYYYSYDTFIWTNGNLNQEYTVYGVESKNAINYISEGISKQTLDLFDSTINPIIVSYDLVQRFDIAVGQKITLDLGNKNSGVKATLSAEFVVVGIDYAMTQNDRVMIINNDSFVIDNEIFTAQQNMVFVITDKDVPNKDLYYDLRDRLEGTGYILQYNDWVYATSVGITGLISLLNILQIMISAVAFVGIINLTIVSFLDRKREFNIYKSVGMDKKAQGILLLCEGIILALSGGIVGFVLSVVMNNLMPTFALMIDRFLLSSIVPLSALWIALAVVVCYSLIYFALGMTAKKIRNIERNIV